jgi:branched-chain amino acid transport system substrate-binding protein
MASSIRIRRKVRTFVFFIGLMAMLAGFVLGEGIRSDALAAEKGPIKIGFIAAITGNWAQFGNDMVDGFKLFLNEINYTAAGRKIEFIVEDEGANPAFAVTKARKLIAHDKVDLIAGVFSAGSAIAVAPICLESKTPLLITIGTADDITQRKRSPYAIRVNWGTSSEWGHVAGDYAYKKLGWRRAAIIAMDYNFGHEVAGGFLRTFQEAGGKVVQRVWTPVNTTDYGPYVTSLKRDVDGVLDVVTGAATIRLLNTFRNSGHDWKIIGPGPITDETFLPALGNDAVGVYTVLSYSPVLDNPENQKFKEDMKKFAKKDATGFQSINYTAADWIVRGIKAVNGDLEDRDRFMAALRSVEIPNSMRGPLKMDKYGQLIQNQYVRRTDKVGDRCQNAIIDMYPNPTQFWKYDPETFLKEPVYSRDNPPCKYCE